MSVPDPFKGCQNLLELDYSKEEGRVCCFLIGYLAFV